MAIWEKIDCSADSVNQGYGKCTIDFGMLNRHIAIPKGEIIPATALADFENYLKQKASDPNPAKRWYITGEFVTYEQQNSDAQSQTAGNGLVRFTNVGQFGWDVHQWSGGFCAYKNMLKLHQSQDRFDFLNIHSNNVVAGVLTKDAAGEDAMKGISMMQVFTPNWKGSDGGANGTDYMMNFRVGNASQMRELYTAMKLDFDIAEIPQIIDVTLHASVSGANYDVTAVTSCGGEDLSSVYGTEMADPDAFVVTNGTNGVEVTPASVTLVGGKFRFTFTPADPNLPTTGQFLLFAMAGIDELEDLGVIGYESNTSSVKVP